MKNRFSIGDMAKLHNTTVKTLRYYDEIELLKPVEVDRNSGYRYYSTEQFELLNTIQYFKELGFSLKEIKEHFDHRDVERFMDLLVKQKELTEQKIRELQRIHRKYENRINDIKHAQEINELEVPTVKEIGERKIVRLMEKITSDPELEVSLRKLENSANMRSSIFIGGVGLTVDHNNLQSKKFDEYNSIFLLIEDENIQSPLVTTLPKGKFVSIYYRGDHHDSAPFYKLLLQYVKENGLHIIGDSIERTIIDHYISNKKEDFLTEIQIPIKC